MILQALTDYYHRKAEAAGPGQAALEADITGMLQGANTAGGASLVVPSEYLEAVIVKRSE